MNKTEKFRGHLKAIQVYDGEWCRYFPIDSETVGEILKVCKESGLKFVPDIYAEIHCPIDTTTPNATAHIEDIDV